MKKYLITGLAAVAISGMFTSCTHETDAGAGGTNLGVVETYEQAFISRFGTPSADADWGFGNGATKAGTRTGNMEGKTPVAQTSTGINANANEWADKADAPHGHGGWLVPDPLTKAQKELVTKFFQTHDKLEYDDPKYANFFVQQVYKGDSIVKHEDTTEGIIAANGTPYASGTMNLLTVGKAPQQHINNFNRGTGSTVSVLDRGYTANDASTHSHPDEIMLMVNIDDTQCMGYHETGSSTHHDDKAALVSWETIRKWARDEKIYTEDILNDGWNRSFVGFDLALKSLEDSYAKNNGELVYARFDQVPSYNNFEYVWDGNQTLKISTGSSNNDVVLSSNDIDLSSFVNLSGKNYYWNPKPKMDNDILEAYIAGWQSIATDEFASDWSECESMVVTFEELTPSNGWINVETSNNVWLETPFNQGVSSVTIDLSGKNAMAKRITIKVQNDATLRIKQIHVNGTIKEVSNSTSTFSSEFLIGDDIKIPFLDRNTNQYAGESRTVGENDWTYYDSNGRKCVNLKFFKDLFDDGWYPTSTALRDWSKWEGGDGYFSDWIVTLTEAKRADDTPGGGGETTTTTSIRVIAEDMGDQSLNENSDFDFNDVVFDVTWKSESEVEIEILAAGGTLPLTVGWDGVDESKYRDFEVHNLLGYSETMIINTHSSVGNHIDDVPSVKRTLNGTFRKDHFAEDVRDNIPVKVKKNGVWYDIKADQGKVAGKLAVDKEYEPWCNERKDIDDWWMNADKQGLFSKYTQAPTTLTKFWYKQAKYRQLTPDQLIELK